MEKDTVMRLRDEFQRREAEVQVKMIALKEAIDNANQAKAEWESEVKRQKEREELEEQRQKEREELEEQRQKERAEKKRQRVEQRQEERAEKKRQCVEQRQKEHAVLRAKRAIQEREALKAYKKLARKLERRLSKISKKAAKKNVEDDKKPEPCKGAPNRDELVERITDMPELLAIAEALGSSRSKKLMEDREYPVMGTDGEPFEVDVNSLKDPLLGKPFKPCTYFTALAQWLEVLDSNVSIDDLTFLEWCADESTNMWMTTDTSVKKKLNTIFNAIIGKSKIKPGLHDVYKATSGRPILDTAEMLYQVVEVPGEELFLWPVMPVNFPKAPVLSVAEQIAAVNAAGVAQAAKEALASNE
jgi:chemotaxis protein histidine kinase CheA